MLLAHTGRHYVGDYFRLDPLDLDGHADRVRTRQKACYCCRNTKAQQSGKNSAQTKAPEKKKKTLRPTSISTHTCVYPLRRQSASTFSRGKETCVAPDDTTRFYGTVSGQRSQNRVVSDQGMYPTRTAYPYWRFVSCKSISYVVGVHTKYQ